MPRSITSRELELSSGQERGEISLSEIISAMTFALDLTEGAIPGHGLRSCLLGMRLARALQLSEAACGNLYYALQLKDIGCSSNASRVTKIMGGDDREIKAATKLEDWRKGGMSSQGLKAMWRNTLPDSNLPARAARFAKVARDAGANRKALIQTRCERGGMILRQLAMDPETAEAVWSLDEHWDGGGHPVGRSGEAIPLGARLCAVAQHLDIFGTAHGREAALETLEARQGVWFDPALVRLARSLHDSGTLWEGHGVGMRELQQTVMSMDPGYGRKLTPERVDSICEAFAAVVDAKSPFTFRHSVCVAQVAVAVANVLGLEPERVQLLRRAGLLHDIGKLSISSAILEKRSELTSEEWIAVIQHPVITRSILERVSAFRELAVVASEHHERLDGTGYPWGLTAEQMSLESMVLATADVFTAMVEMRPYSDGMQPEKALWVLGDMTTDKLDAECVEALRIVVRDETLVAAFPPGTVWPLSGNDASVPL